MFFSVQTFSECDPKVQFSVNLVFGGAAEQLQKMRQKKSKYTQKKIECDIVWFRSSLKKNSLITGVKGNPKTARRPEVQLI